MKFSRYLLFGPLEEDKRHIVWSVFDSSGRWKLECDYYKTKDRWKATADNKSQIFSSKEEAFGFLYEMKTQSGA